MRTFFWCAASSCIRRTTEASTTRSWLFIWRSSSFSIFPPPASPRTSPAAPTAARFCWPDKAGQYESGLLGACSTTRAYPTATPTKTVYSGRYLFLAWRPARRPSLEAPNRTNALSLNTASSLHSYCGCSNRNSKAPIVKELAKHIMQIILCTFTVDKAFTPEPLHVGSASSFI